MRRLLCLLSVAVAACSTVPPQVDDGRQAIAEGRIEEGLALLADAARDHPQSAVAKSVYATTREAIVVELVRRGGSARVFGELDDAERQYRRALAIDPASVAAKSGLAELARDRRHQQLVAEAEAALKADDLATAEAKAREVLAENSSQRGARAVIRAVSERRVQPDTVPPTLKAALGRPISLEFRDANLRSVFEVFARTSGINFVFDRDVRPDIRVTVFVRNTNVDDVIRLLLVTNQLDRRILNENSVLIYPNTPAKQREYQELVVRSFYLANADVKQTAAMIRALVKTRDMFIDEKLNLLVIRDTPAAVRLAEKLVATQDLGDPEVMLEVEVLEVSSSKLLELGVRWPDRLNYGLLEGGPGAVTGAAPPPLVRIPSDGFHLFIANPALVANLRKLDGSVNLLANPRIRVKNREKAKIHIGERVPVITTTSTANVGVSASVSYLEVGLKLEVEPNIFLEDEVAIKMVLDVSNILEQLNVSGTVAYRLGTRNTATALRLRDGETQVLAGLISDEDRQSGTKLPILGDFPLLGRLFGTNLDQRTKTEIVLLMTPRIVRNLARPAGLPAEFHAGTDAAPGAAPLQAQVAAGGALALSPTAGAPAPPTPAALAAARIEAARIAPIGALWAAPSQAVVGREFVVNVGLPPGTDARSARMDIAYDARVLQPIGGTPAGEGRVAVEIAGPGVAGGAVRPVELRFRVVATAPTATQLRIENASAVDGNGNPVGLVTPGTHALAIVAQ